jgi:hypothetical protein
VRSLHTFSSISRNIKGEELHFSFLFFSSEKKVCCEKFRPGNETLAGEQALIVAWTLNRGSKPFLN